MLAGLLIYAVACLGVFYDKDFSVLLGLRMLSALVAVGSVGTQTIMRDVYSGDRTAKSFLSDGAAIALSPAIGVLSGSLLVSYAGFNGVFSGLAHSYCNFLLLWSAFALPESRPETIKNSTIRRNCNKKCKDKQLPKQYY